MLWRWQLSHLQQVQYSPKRIILSIFPVLLATQGSLPNYLDEKQNITIIKFGSLFKFKKKKKRKENKQTDVFFASKIPSYMVQSCQSWSLCVGYGWLEMWREKNLCFQKLSFFFLLNSQALLKVLVGPLSIANLLLLVFYFWNQTSVLEMLTNSANII